MDGFYSVTIPALYPAELWMTVILIMIGWAVVKFITGLFN